MAGSPDNMQTTPADGDHVVASTTYGSLRGEWRNGVARFAGIPFAAPPTGSLRFRAPRPPAPWDGQRDATAFGAVSPQNASMMDALFGGEAEPWEEDCLHLNVWTTSPAPLNDSGAAVTGEAAAANPDTAPMPVMVWIHGGGFEMGSGSSPLYDGTRFAHDGVVFVSLNYRLGSLGFLDLTSVDPAEAGSGNVGLLDQIAALEWVRNNIASFGGDPDDVTIFGESAGAMSVSLLLTAERAQGLFHKAIAQSGALMAKPAPTARADTAEFMAAAGVTTVAELRAMPVEELLKAHATMSAVRLADPEAVIRRTGSPISFLSFTPVADGVVLPTDPEAELAAGSAAGVALLTGTNLEEWKLFSMMSPPIEDDDDLRRRVGLMTTDVDGALSAYAADGGEQSPADVECAVLTDVVFCIPATRMADAQVAHAPVHQYRFDWKSPAFGGMIGAAHAVEIPFVFQLVNDHRLHVLIGSDAPAELADAMHDAWVSFARTGTPSVAGIGTWPSLPKNASTRPVVLFDSTISLANDPQADTRRFWIG